ncbi:hypothetical protein [Catellatospora sp. NPDC049609]|uniref:hypothetical protein n=1 Tax=Catellatospora sp. NPDC049609 TaxID=3155505 RepID=UPI0034269082
MDAAIRRRAGGSAFTARSTVRNIAFAAMVDDVRRRQAAGELAADLDPAYVLLTLFAAAMAPTLLPQIVRRVTGRAADSPEFLDEYAGQLRRVIERLR